MTAHVLQEPAPEDGLRRGFGSQGSSLTSQSAQRALMAAPLHGRLRKFFLRGGFFPVRLLIIAAETIGLTEAPIQFGAGALRDQNLMLA